MQSRAIERMRAGVAMACTNAIVVMSVMGTSPARLNRHGGIAMASMAAPMLIQPEPCPYDADFALVTSFPWPTPDAHSARHHLPRTYLTTHLLLLPYCLRPFIFTSAVIKLTLDEALI